MSLTRITGDVAISGDPDELAAGFALKVVIPLAEQIAKDQGIEGVRLFYAAFVTLMLGQARAVMTSSEVAMLGRSATREAVNIDIEPLQPQRH